MSAPRPHSTADLVLAPILISIERNLERLRDSSDLEYELALELNDDDRWYHSPAERAERVAQVAIRDVELHGWQVRPSADRHGLVVEHDGYRVSLMFGRQVTDYIERGAPAAAPPPAAATRDAG